MMRAMKKLRLWSKKRKKLKKKKEFNYSPSPYHYPLCTHCTCSCQYLNSYSPVQPSAPPLPPWIQTPPHPSDQLLFREEEEEEIAHSVVAREEIDVYLDPGSYQQYFAPPTSPPAGAGPPARTCTAQMQPSSSKLHGWFGGFFRRLKGCFCSCFGLS